MRASDLPRSSAALPGQVSRRGSDAGSAADSEAFSEVSDPADVDIAEELMRAAMENAAQVLSFDGAYVNNMSAAFVTAEQHGARTGRNSLRA